MPGTLVAIAWYKREDYEAIRSTFSDGYLLPETYELWLTKAERLRNAVSQHGGVPYPVEIDPDPFRRWCRGRGIDPPNSQACRVYVNAAALEKHRGGG